MSRDRVVIVPQNLLLERIRRNADGSLQAGHVVNGEWWFSIKDKMMCCNGNKVWPLVPFKEIAVPDTMRGNYNEIIEWARKQ